MRIDYTNDNYDFCKEEEKRRERIKEQMRINAIKQQKYIEEEDDYDDYYCPRSAKRTINKNKFKAIIIAVTLLAIPSSIAHTIGSDIYYNSHATEITDEAKKTVLMRLKENHLHTFQGPDGEFHNDYDDLIVYSHDIYGYLNLLGYEETEKIIQSIGYSGWNEFLIHNEYVDSNGNPSLEVFEEMEIKELVDKNARRK